MCSFCRISEDLFISAGTQDIWSTLFNATKIQEFNTLTLPKQVPLYLILLISLLCLQNCHLNVSLYFLSLKYYLMRNRIFAYPGFPWHLFLTHLLLFKLLIWYHDPGPGSMKDFVWLNRHWPSHMLNDLADEKVDGKPHIPILFCGYIP